MIDVVDSVSLLETIEALISENQLNVGEEAYVLSNKWLTKLKMAARKKEQFSLPIDNTVLLDSKGKLKSIVISPSDYILVNQLTWELITSSIPGGPVITAPVVENPKTKQPIAITHPLAVRLFVSIPTTRSLLIPYQINDTISTFKGRICKKFGWDPCTIRIRNYPNKIGRILDESKYIYENADISDGIYFEIKNYKGEFDPIYPTDKIQHQTINSRKYKPGLVGLRNFGNTCFMNSILQCLGHIEQILKGVETMETEEPIAKEFQNSIRAVWNKGDHSKLLPELTKKAPQFEGRFMQDPHEFMIKLFDILKTDSKNPKDNIIHNTFDFIISHTVSCTNCGEKTGSNTVELELDVTLREMVRPILYIPFDRAREPYTVEKLSDIEGSYTEFKFNPDDQTAPLIVLEVPEDNKQYAMTFVDLEGKNKIYRNFVLPILVSVTPTMDKDRFLELAEERLLPYWAGISEDEDVQLSSIEASLPEAISSNDKKSHKIEVTQFPDRFTKSDNNSLKCSDRVVVEPVHVLIKGGYAHKSLGFDWKLVSQTSVQVATLGSQQNLIDLLLDDAKPTEIEGDSTGCSKCNSPVLRNATLVTTPQILILVLSRFRFNNGTPTKNCSSVDYPSKFDIKKVYPELESTTYELCGVVTHKGGPMYGHCEAYCPFDGRWYLFSDEFVSETNNDGIDPFNAYILFYRKL